MVNESLEKEKQNNYFEIQILTLVQNLTFYTISFKELS